MSVSWRHILEKAGDDLAHEQTVSSHKRESSRIRQPVDPIANARSLLQRELHAMSPSSERIKEPTYSIPGASRGVEKHSGQIPAGVRTEPNGIINNAPQHRWGRNLVAVLLSSTIIASTVYTFLQQSPLQPNAAEGVSRRALSFGEANAASRSILFDDNEGVKAKAQEVRGGDPADSPLADQEEDVLLYRASKLLETGDATAARAMYEKLAARGSPRGAVGLAETYDPNILAKVAITGLKPDAEAARKWYKRAAALGNKSASERMKALDSAVN